MKKRYVLSSMLSGTFFALGLLTFVTSNAQSGGAIYTSGPAMDRTRIFPFVATLPDNRVIAFGGREAGFISSSYSDIYNPTTNSFVEVAMNYPHDNTYAVKLFDGRYYVIGGSMDLGVAPGYSSCETFKPADNSFTAAGSMNYARMWMCAAQINNGNVVIAGAWYDNTAAGVGEYYDTSAHTYTLTGALITPRADAIMLPTNDGGAELFGGVPSFSGSAITNVEYYSPTDNSFHAVSSELIPADPGWLITEDYHKKPYSDYKMGDSRYLLLASRTGEYGLLAFDPAAKTFSRITTTTPIMDAFADGGIYDWVLDKANNRAYLLAADSGYDPIKISLITVNLTTGDIYHPGSTFTLPSSEYPLGTLAFIPSNGKILMEGISSSGSDYFHATDKTYLISPQTNVGINEVAAGKLNVVCYPNPANDMLNFRVTDKVSGTLSIRVYDMMGRIIESSECNAPAPVISLPVRQLPYGMYFYEVRANGFVARDRFVKK